MNKAKKISYNIEFMQDDVVHLILDYLKENGLYKSIISLVEETSIDSLWPTGMSKETRFVRSLIFQGQWNDLEHYLEPLAKDKKISLKLILLILREQEFLESVNGMKNEEESNTTSNELMHQLIRLKEVSNDDQFKEYAYLLTLSSVTDHPNYSAWNIFKGRIECYEKILIHLQDVFPISSSNQLNAERYKKTSPCHLLNHLAQSVLHQISDTEISDSMSFDLLVNNKQENILSPLSSFSMSSMDWLTSKSSMDMMTKSVEIFQKKSYINEEEKQIKKISSVWIQKLSNDHELLKISQIPLSTKILSSPSNSSYLSKSMDIITTSTKECFNNKQALPLSPSPLNKQQNFHHLKKNFQDSKIKENNLPHKTKQEEFSINKKKSNSHINNHYIINHDVMEIEFHEIDDDIFTERYEKVDNTATEEEDKKDQEEEMNISILDTSLIEKEKTMEKEINDSSLNQERITNMYVCNEIQENQAIRACSFSPNGNHLAIGTNAKSLKIYSIPKQEEKEILSYRSHFSSSLQLQHVKERHHNGSIYCIDWNKENSMLVTGSNDKLVKIVCLNDFMEIKEQVILCGHKGTVRDVRFGNENNMLYSAGAGDYLIRLWDIHSSVLMPWMQFDGHAGSIYSIQISKDGQNVLSASEDSTIRLWDLKSGCCEKVFSSASSPPLIISFHPIQEYYFASGHEDGSVSVWDRRTGKLIKTTRYHQGECRALDWSPDGKWILSGSFDGSICLFDANQNTLRANASYHQHNDKVLQTKWHPYISLFVSTGADQMVKLWSNR